jgi:carbonic anhydrase
MAIPTRIVANDNQVVAIDIRRAPSLCGDIERPGGVIVSSAPAIPELLAERNGRFAESRFEELPFAPRLGACVVTCPDARVDPAHVLGLEPGDAAIVRAAGGRVSPIVLQQLMFLAHTAAARGIAQGELELVLMTHTDCGITSLLGDEHRDALAAFLGCAVDELDAKAAGDPHAAVRADIATLANSPLIPASLSVTGLVYDVHSGRVEIVERRSPLRREAAA